MRMIVYIYDIQFFIFINTCNICVRGVECCGKNPQWCVAIPQLRCLLATFEMKYIDIQSVPLER